MSALRIVADDLSGAVEAAGMALSHTPRVRVQLRHGAEAEDADVIAIDLDSRATASIESFVRDASYQLAAVSADIKKIDSLLRGHIGAELAADIYDRRRIVVAAAHPDLGRTFVQGQLLVDGIPLQQSSLGSTYVSDISGSLSRAVAPRESVGITLDAVRGSRTEFAATLAAVPAGVAAICDCETHEDLDAIAAAAQQLPGKALMVGSAPIVNAALKARNADLRGGQPAQHQKPPPDARELTGLGRPTASSLILSGSVAPGIAAQLDAVSGQMPLYTAEPDQLLEPSAAAEFASCLQHQWRRNPRLAVAIAPKKTITSHGSHGLVAELISAVLPVARGAELIVVTGGHTARQLLEALGVRVLRPVRQLIDGTVLAAAPRRIVAIRPGSFGSTQSLLAAAEAGLAEFPMEEDK